MSSAHGPIGVQPETVWIATFALSLPVADERVRGGRAPRGGVDAPTAEEKSAECERAGQSVHESLAVCLTDRA